MVAVVFLFGLFPVFFISFLCAAFELRGSLLKSLGACVLNMVFGSVAVLVLVHTGGTFSVYFFLLLALLEGLLSFEILWLAGGIGGVKKLAGESIFCLVAGNILFILFWFFLFDRL